MKPESEFLPAHSESVPTTATRLCLAIGLRLAGLVALYWGTAKSLVETWAATDIFQHGFVVVPISLWLAWRLRDRTSINEVRPFWPGLGAVAAAGALWTLGVLVAAQNVEHLAFVLVIQAALVTILGLQVAKTFAFPIGFLLFAVPLGEGLDSHAHVLDRRLHGSGAARDRRAGLSDRHPLRHPLRRVVGRRGAAAAFAISLRR